MPNLSLSRACLAVLLLPLAQGAGALTCPAGQQQVCLLTCFCAPGSQEDMGDIYAQVGQLAASGMENWVLQARSTAAAGEVKPIPLHIRAQLEPFFAMPVLETVRYKVGNAKELDAATAMLQNPDVQAVTYVDIIVFREAEAAENDVALWAHELKHVEQYMEWGVAEFARRYTRDYQTVEAPGYEMQIKVAKALRGQATASGPAE